MQRGGGTNMSEEWRDAESLVAFVMQDPTWTSVCSVLSCNSRTELGRKFTTFCILHICHSCGKIFNLRIVFSVTKGFCVS